VEIDECGGCGGIWLDAGELAKIREELREPTHTRVEVSLSILSYLATGTQT
jgi:Zn-finger nucleic acid-binding protein